MNYLRRMFSGSNSVSWGRHMATVLLVFVVVMTLVMMGQTGWKTWPAVDPVWRDIIIALFGISKTGETVQKFSKKTPDDGSGEAE